MMDKFKKGFKEFGHSITAVINTLLLSIVYIIGIGLTSIIAKLSKKRFIDLRPKNNNTYWRELNLSKKPKEDYCRQF
jgi:hypothetical protein